MALSTARIPRVRGRPPLLAAGITSLIHSHSSSVKSLGYVFSFIYLCYTTYEDFSDRLLDTLEAGDLWIEDRNFCTRAFLCEIDKRGAFCVTREHQGLPFEILTPLRSYGPTPTG